LGVIKRINQLLGLRDLDIFVEDTAFDSQYFRVLECPQILTQGKSSFLIGGSQYLKPGVDVKFEIVHDLTKEVIYTEAVFGHLEGDLRRVSIEVYSDIIPGPATLYIVGELNPDTSDVTIPNEWQGIYNVRWTKRITINAAGVNTQSIYFHKQPRINVAEIFRGYIIKPAQPILTAYLTGSGKPREGLRPIAPTPGRSIGGNKRTTATYPERDFAEKANLAIIEEHKIERKLTGKEGHIGKQGKLLKTQSPASNDYLITVNSTSPVSSSYVGQTFTINNPQVDDGRFTLEDHYTLPTVYTSSIMKVLNETTFVPSRVFYINDTRTSPSTLIPAPLAEQYITASYQNLPSAVTSSVNYFSFADIELSDLRTFSGDVHRVKIYAKSEGSIGDFEKIYDSPIESSEILFDGSDKTMLGNMGYLQDQSRINKYWQMNEGTFGNGSSVTLDYNTTYFMDSMQISGSNRAHERELRVQLKETGSFVAGNSYTIRANLYGIKTEKVNIQEDVLLDGEFKVYTSGSAFNKDTTEGSQWGVEKLSVPDFPDGVNEYDFGVVQGDFLADNTGPGVIQFKVPSGRWYVSDISVKASSDTAFNPEYVNVVAPMPKTRSRPDKVKFLVEFYDVNNNIADSVIFSDFFTFEGENVNIGGTDNILSGSMFIGNALAAGIEMAGVSSAYVRSMGYLGFSSGSGKGGNSGTGENSGFLMWSGSVLSDSGDNYSGVGLELVGTSESYFRFRTDPSELDIRANAFFVGSETSQYISGSGGNIEISSSQFHLSGGNATMQGTVSATAGEIGGWTIESGRLTAGTGKSAITMSGVDQIFQFGSGSTFNKGDLAGGIRMGRDTDGKYKFAIGTSTSYITFDGTEISLKSDEVDVTASLFNVDVDVFKLSANNLFISSSEGGFISAGNPRPTGIDGTNKGFWVQGNNAGDNKVKVLIGDADGNRLTFDGDNFVMSASTFFLGSSGQYISGSLGDIEISSSNFHLDNSGNVIMSGKVTANEGAIGGFTITGDALSSTNFFISGSPTAGGNDDPTYMFISASNFNVKASGDVTASALSLTGGDVAGLKVESGVISVGEILKLKDSGQITGSQVLFTGGKVGGWELASTMLKSTDGNIRLNSNAKKITINSHTFGNSGIQLDYNAGTPRFYVGDGSNDYLTYTHGTGVDIKTAVFKLDTAQFDIDSSTNSGKMSMGSTPPTAYNSGTGIYMDGTGKLLVGNSSGDRIQFDGSDFTVKVGSLELDATNIEISSTQASMSLGEGKIILSGSQGGVIKLGEDNDNLTLTEGNGIFLSGSGEFKMGDADGGIRFVNDSFSITGSDVSINVTQFNVSASGFTLSSPQASMSLGNNKEILLHATGGSNSVPIFKLDGGEISASEFFVDAQGQITASAGLIGGFELASTQINSSNDNLILKSSGQITGSSVLLDGGKVGGWTITANQLEANNIKINAAVGYIEAGDLTNVDDTADSSTGFFVNKDGEILLKAGTTANKNYLKFKDGTLDINTDKAHISGSEITLKTPDFYLGDLNNYISGSGGNLAIYSTGNTTLSGSSITLKTPDFYLGDSSNYVSGSGGNLAIYSTGNTTLSGSSVKIKTPDFYFGDSSVFLSGSGGDLAIGASNFSVDSSGNLTLGDTSNEHIYIANGSDLLFKNSSTIMAELDGTTWTLGGATGATDDSIKLSAGGGVQIYDSSTDYASITSTGFDVIEGGTNVAHFGSISRVGDVANEHMSMSSDGMHIKDGSTTRALFTGGGATLGVTSGPHISASTADVTIFQSSDDYLKIDSDSVDIYAGGNLQGTFAATTKIGTTADFLELDSTSIDFMRNTSTSVMNLTDTAFRLGDSSNEHIIVDTDGLVIKDSSTVRGKFTAGGATIGVTSEPHISASTSDITIYGNDTTDYLKLSSGDISMYTNSVKGVHIIDSKMSLGPAANASATLGAVIGNIHLASTGAYVYGNATNTFTAITSAGMETTLAGTKVAIFGSTTAIGGASAVTTTSTDKVVRIDTNGIKLYFDSNNYTQIDSNSLDIVLGGQTSASFGTTTTIGPTGGKHVSITSSGIALKVASTTYGTFAETVTVGNTSDAYMTLDGTNFKMYDGGGAQKVNINATRTTLGGADNATDDTIILTPGSGVKIYDNSTNYVSIDSDSFDVILAGQTSASFGATTTIGPTGGRHVKIDSGGVTTQFDSNNYSKMDSDSLDIVLKGQTSASFGTTTTIGPTGGRHIAIDSSDVKVKFDSNNYSRMDSDSLDVVLGGQISASFGTTTTIGPTSGNHVKIDANAISIKTDPNTTVLSASAAGLEMAGTIQASGGTIGGATITSDKLAYSPYWAISASAATADPVSFISSSAFKVSAGGNITGSQVLFTGGKIAGFELSGNTLTATYFTLDASGKSITLGNTATDDVFIVDADTGIQLGHNTFSSAPFSVTKAGVLKAESGTIGGWNIDSSKIYSTNLNIHSTGIIETGDFASGVKGWRLDSANNGQAEFENVTIRGTLSTAVFEKESVNAVGGQLYIANSTSLTGSQHISASATTMSVVNVGGFTGSYSGIGAEIITAKKLTTTGFSTEYMLVQSASRNVPSSDSDFSGKLYVVRGYRSGSSDIDYVGENADVSHSYAPGQVFASTGTSGSGYVRINANPSDTSTPYIDIVERTGSGVYDVELKARLGDLSGLSSTRLHGTNPAHAGFGLYSQNVFLEGGINANTGSIGGIKMQSSKLYTGTGTFQNANTGFYLDSSANFSLGDNFSVDASANVTIGDTSAEHIYIADGSDLVFKNSSTVMAELDGTTWTLGGATGTTDDSVVLSSGGGVTLYDSSTYYAVVDSDGLKTYADGTKMGEFGTTVYVGDQSNEHIKLSSTGLEVKDNTTVRGLFSAGGVSIGVDTGPHISASTSDIYIKQSSTDYLKIDSDSIDIYTGGALSASFAKGGVWLGPLSGPHISASRSDIYVKQSANDYLKIDSDSVDIYLGGALSASFGPTTYIGPSSGQHVKIDSDGVTTQFDSNNYSKLDSDSLDIVLGGQTSASFGATTTIGSPIGKHIRIDSGGVYVSGSVGNYTKMDSDSFDVYLNSQLSASFGTTTTIGPTGGKHVSITSSGLALKVGSTEYGKFAETVTIGNTSDAYMTLNSGELAMFDEEATQLVTLNTGRLTLGGTDGNTDDSIVLTAGSGVAVYESSTNYTDVTSAGLRVYHGGQLSASFGTTTHIGPTGGSHVLIDSSGVTTKFDSNNYSKMDSDSLDIVLAGQTSASFGTTTTIGPTGGRHVKIDSGGVTVQFDSNNYSKIDSDSLDIYAGGTKMSEFGTTVYVGDQSNEHVKLSSTGLELKDNTTVRGLFTGGGITLGVTSGPHISASTTDIYIKQSSDDYLKIDSDSVDIYAGGNLQGTFAATTKIGTTADFLELDSTSIDFMRNTSTSVMNLTDSAFRLGDSSAEHIIVDTSGLTIKDSSTVRGKFVAGGATIGVTSGPHISASTTDIHIKQSSDDYLKIDSDSVDIYAGGNLQGTFAAITKIGTTADYLELDSTSIDFMRNTSTSVMNLTDTAFRLGDSSAEHIIVDTSGLTIKDSSTVRGKFTAGGATIGVTSEPHISASTSDITIYGDDTTDYLTLSSGNISMYTEGVRGVHIIDDKISLGPIANASATLGAVIGNIHLASTGAYIYGNAATTFASLTSAGLEFTEAGTKKAIFGSITAIGGASAVTTISTDKVVRIDSTGIKLYYDSNNYTQVDSNSFNIISGGHTSASFGATTTIGPKSGSHVKIDSGGVTTYFDSSNYSKMDSDSLDIILGGETSASFGTTTTIGPTGGSHVLIDSSQIAIKRGDVTFLSASAAGLEMSGSIKASDGTIGGWTIGSSTLTGTNTTLASSGNLTLGDNTNDIVRLSADDGTYRLWTGHATAASAPFRVSKLGVLTAAGAVIDGEISITSGDLAGVDATTISGSANKFSASLALASQSMATQVKLSSTGMTLQDASSNTLASYGATVTIGQDANDKSRMYMDSDSVDLIVDAGGTDTIYASFGATTTVGVTGNNEYVNIDSDGVKVYGGSATTFAQVDADSFNIISGGHTSASFGATTTIGPTSGSHVLIDGSGLSIKSGGVTFLSASASGLDMSGSIKATSGTIGGFAIDGTSIIADSNKVIMTTAGENVSALSGMGLSGSLIAAKEGIFGVPSRYWRFETGVLTSRSGSTANGIRMKSEDATIRIGAETGTMSMTNKTGVFMSGSGTFRVGDPDGERLSYDGSNFVVSSSAFLLGNSTTFVSGSLGDFRIGTRIVDRDNTFLTSSAATASLTGATVEEDRTWLFNSGSVMTRSGRLENMTVRYKVIDDGTATGTIRIYKNGVLVDEPAVHDSLPGLGAVTASISLTGSVATYGGGDDWSIMFNARARDVGGVDQIIYDDSFRFDVTSSFDDAMLFDSSQGLIAIGSASFGETGIQLQANPTSTDGSKFYVGKKGGAHLKFENDSIEISSSNFYLGGGGQFLSGSNGNIEISSSNFHLTNAGDVTMQGKVTATSGEIGGYTIGTGKLTVGDSPGINISGSGVIFAGDITNPGNQAATYLGVLRENSINGVSASLFTGVVADRGGKSYSEMKIQKMDSFVHQGYQMSAGNYFKMVSGEPHFRIGNSYPYFNFNGSDQAITISGSGFKIHLEDGANDFVLSSSADTSRFQITTPQFFFGESSQYISGSNGNLEISSSNFFVKSTGDVTMAGTVTATAGKIGDWVITGSNMESDTDFYRGIKFKPSDRVVGYGSTAHTKQTVSGSFSFGVLPAPPGGGGGFFQ